MLVPRRVSALLRRSFRPCYQQRDPCPCMSLLHRSFSAKLFVGGLSFRTAEEGLKNAFSVHGAVSDVRIVVDRETGKSKGFGFVTLESEADAEIALSKMNGAPIDGRAIRVDRASVRSSPSTRPVDGCFDEGMASSASSTNPAEDWGTIASNVVHIPVEPQAVPPQFDDASLPIVAPSPFDHSTFGAAASSYTLSNVPFESSGLGIAALNSHLSEATSEQVGVPSPAASVDNAVMESRPESMANLSACSTQSSQPVATGSFGAVVSPGPSDPPGQASVTGPADSSQLMSTEGQAFQVSSSGAEDAAPSTLSNPPAPISPAINSAGQFDFTKFSAFDHSSYQDEPSLPRRRPRPRPRTIPSSSSSSLTSSSLSSLDIKAPFVNNLAETAIPKPKGPEFDFGLPESANTPPQIAPGARPQGAFDVDIPEGTLQEPPPEPAPKPKPTTFSIFPQRTLPSLDLPWNTPEADSWSAVGEDPPKFDLSMIYAPLKTFLKKDKELFWDPFDFDEDAKLPPEPSEDEETEEEFVV